MNKSPYTRVSQVLIKRNKKFVSIIFFLLALFFYCSPVSGQEDQKEKASPRIGLVSTQINGDSVLLEASVKVKTDGWQPVDFVWIKFDVNNDSLTKPLGVALADDRGVASIKVGIKNLIAGEDGSWMFGSVFEGNEEVNKGESELSIKPARMSMSGERQDSLLNVTLRLFVPGSDNLPIAETEVGLYVKRHFSNLKIGEGTTDENGEVTIECPGDLPGDLKGNIIIIGKAEDLEEYGSVAAFMTQPWGTPLQQHDQKVMRELWSHSPPLWMVIVFAVLMTTVWGHYIVIIYKLVKLRKPKIQNT